MTEIKELEAAAREAGIVLLNEVGWILGWIISIRARGLRRFMHWVAR
jgi:hypothetical protein